MAFSLYLMSLLVENPYFNAVQAVIYLWNASVNLEFYPTRFHANCDTKNLQVIPYHARKLSPFPPECLESSSRPDSYELYVFPHSSIHEKTRRDAMLQDGRFSC